MRVTRKAFEAYLRESGVPYVAVDEAKKALFAGVDLASFDFVVYSAAGPNWLTTCRPFSQGDTRRAMDEWQKVFGSGFAAAEVCQRGGRFVLVMLDGAETELPPLVERCAENPAAGRGGKPLMLQVRQSGPWTLRADSLADVPDTRPATPPARHAKAGWPEDGEARCAAALLAGRARLVAGIRHSDARLRLPAGTVVKVVGANVVTGFLDVVSETGIQYRYSVAVEDCEIDQHQAAPVAAVAETSQGEAGRDQPTGPEPGTATQNPADHQKKERAVPKQAKNPAKGKGKKAEAAKETHVSIDLLAIDLTIQARAETSDEVVADYAEKMEAGANFPPVVAFDTGKGLIVADGIHRVLAARRAGLLYMMTEIRKGTREDALWAAVAANQCHGLRRTNADKARAVAMALAARPGLSDRAIAEHVGVSNHFVAACRPAPGGNGSHLDKRTGLDGKEYPATQKPAERPAKSTAAPPVGDLADPDDIPFETPGPAAPTRVLDQLGTVLEPCVAKVYRRRDEIARLMSAVSDLKTAVTKAVEAGDPLFLPINLSQFQADCGNLYRALRAARPYAACPYCRQQGCEACQGRGFVGEVVYSQAPEEMKAGGPPAETEGSDTPAPQKCAGCGTDEADTLYKCQECGLLHCPACIDTDTLICAKCGEEE
jgi:hypothetical protein